jgi:hypothetical protein
VQTDAPCRTYYPLRDESSLFLTFTEIRVGGEVINAFTPERGANEENPWLPFARRYGTLSYRLGDRSPARPVGESLRLWSWHLGWLGHLVAVWGLLLREDKYTLAKVFRWRGGRLYVTSYSGPAGSRAGHFVPVVSVTVPPRPTFLDEIAGEEWESRWPQRGTVPEHLAGYVRAGDSEAAAQWYLRDALDTVLRGSIRFSYGWDSGWVTPAHHLIPATLADAVYLQLALAIERGLRFQKCQGCGRWFELTPGVNRADRLTCSSACRQKAYRLRNQARALLEEGWLPTEVALELRCSMDQLRQQVFEK